MSRGTAGYKRRTWLVLGLLAVGVLSGLIYSSYLQFRDYLIDQTQRQLLATAQVAARGIDALAREYRETLEVLASSGTGWTVPSGPSA